MEELRWMTCPAMRRTAAAALMGGMLVAGCTLEDVGKNVVAGSLDFVSAYTSDLLFALFPEPGTLTGAADDGG